MAKRQRAAGAPTETWAQLRLRLTDPSQTTYELIRPVVLFGQSTRQRAAETGLPARTIARRVQRFTTAGLPGLVADAAPMPARHRLPDDVRQTILALKAEHPPFRPHELATICAVCHGRRPDLRTVRQVVAAGPVPLQPARRFPPYAEIADPIERRRAIVQLHADGWNSKSIAAYLQISRSTVYTTLQRWIADGVLGLENQPHTRHRLTLKTDLQAIETVRQLQANPELGEFRMHAALAQLGIHLSPRTCGRILALNRRLYGLPGPTPAPREPQPMPFQAVRRHQFWTVDIRYLDMHQLGEGMIYVISIIDNYSRAILASALSRSQDLTAYLIVLFAAVRQYGSPEALVSDSGSVFKAHAAQAIYTALGIRKEQIDLGQPWQSYIETHFNVQRRLADWHFQQATTWTELQASHDWWVRTYNVQSHWAHRQRPADRRSPSEVLGWVMGRSWPVEELQRVFQVARCVRRVDRSGSVRFREWDFYGERGLARQRIAVWLSGDAETVTLAAGEEPLAQYTVKQERRQRRFTQVTLLRLVSTRFRPPQLDFWTPEEVPWQYARLRPVPLTRRRRPRARALQATLLLDKTPQASNG